MKSTAVDHDSVPDKRAVNRSFLAGAGYSPSAWRTFGDLIVCMRFTTSVLDTPSACAVSS